MNDPHVELEGQDEALLYLGDDEPKNHVLQPGLKPLAVPDELRNPGKVEKSVPATFYSFNYLKNYIRTRHPNFCRYHTI